MVEWLRSIPCLACVFLLTGIPVVAQKQSVVMIASTSATPVVKMQKVIFSISKQRVDAPYKIVGIRINGKNVPTNTLVELKADWPEHATVVFRNSAPYVAKYVLVQFSAPSQDGSGLAIAATVSAGRIPLYARFNKAGESVPGSLKENPELSLSPNANAVISLSGSTIREMIASATDGRGSPVKVKLQCNAMHFADQTMWLGGSFYTPTGANGQWTKIRSDEFYIGN